MTFPSAPLQVPLQALSQLRQPLPIATLISLGLHGLFFFVLPTLPQSKASQPTEPKTVGTVSLSNQDIERLPDFARSPGGFAGGLNFPNPLVPQSSVLPGGLPPLGVTDPSQLPTEGALPPPPSLWGNLPPLPPLGELPPPTTTTIDIPGINPFPPISFNPGPSRPLDPPPLAPEAPPNPTPELPSSETPDPNGEPTEPPTSPAAPATPTQIPERGRQELARLIQEKREQAQQQGSQESSDAEADGNILTRYAGVGVERLTPDKQVLPVPQDVCLERAVKVEVNAAVTPDGKLDSVQLGDRSGMGALDTAALKAVRERSFEPSGKVQFFNYSFEFPANTPCAGAPQPPVSPDAPPPEPQSSETQSPEPQSPEPQPAASPAASPPNS